MIAPDPATVPAFLTTQIRWVLWREKRRRNRKTGEIETTKVPVGCRAGKDCDITDPLHWATFSDAAAAIGRDTGALDGFGVVLGEVAGSDEWIIGADFDECLDDDGALADWAFDPLVILNSYTDRSPGGRGLKPIARIRAADVAETRRLLGLAENEYARTKNLGEKANGHHAPGVVLYLGKRFFAVTGCGWHGTPKDVRLLDIAQLRQLAHWFGPKEPATERAESSTLPDDPDLAFDAETLRIKHDRAMSNPRFAARWNGEPAGTDTTGSAFDFSLGAMMKAAGFTFAEMREALMRCPHGTGNKHANDLRHWRRVWDYTSTKPPPEPPDWLGDVPPHPGPDASRSGRTDHPVNQPAPPAEANKEKPDGDAETEPLWPEPPPPEREADDFVLPIAYSENALAHQFTIAHAAALIFCHDWNKWMRWETGRWREDHTVSVFDIVRAICARAGEAAIATERGGKKIAATINKAACVSGIERLARHDHRHERDTDDFDADNWLLNSPAATAPMKKGGSK